MEFNLKSTATTTLIFMTPGVPKPENGFCAQYAQCALYSAHRYSVKTIISASDSIFLGDEIGDQIGGQPGGAAGGWLQENARVSPSQRQPYCRVMAVLQP
jgi:hypothetical protein